MSLRVGSPKQVTSVDHQARNPPLYMNVSAPIPWTFIGGSGATPGDQAGAPRVNADL